jgi:hypothetical protein
MEEVDVVDSILKHKKLLPLLIGIHPELDSRIEHVLRRKK